MYPRGYDLLHHRDVRRTRCWRIINFTIAISQLDADGSIGQGSEIVLGLTTVC